MGSEFEIEVARHMMQFATPGISVDMRNRGKKHSAHLGRLTVGGSLPVTKKARYATVCLIKLLIAIDLLLLAEKGEISLDANIGEYLPELSKGPKAKGHFIKIWHLLSHTGGYRSFTVQHLLPLAHESWQNCVGLLHDTEQLFEPGTVFDDDHMSHIILGQILERVRGKPLLEAVQEDVLCPLDISAGNRTTDCEQPEIYASRHSWNRVEKKWDVEADTYSEPDAAFGAISHLSMTSADLLRLGEALLRAPAGSKKQSGFSTFVKERLFSEAVRLPSEITPTRITRWSVKAYGLGMATFRDGHFGRLTTGRGQNNSIVFDRDRQSVIAMAMNTPNVIERETLMNSLLTKFAGDTSIVPEANSLDMDFDTFIHPFTTRDICGIYMGFTPDPVEVFSGPRSFVVRVDKEDRYQFEATPENRLLMLARMPVPFGVFQDPVSRRPCLTMGMHPFKKVS